MSKTLTEMAAEILAARVKHESMTSRGDRKLSQ